MNPVSHRTILLATHSSQSIICEIVDGKTNAIAYSAYGDQSAQQEVATRLGFNGQLREARIDWYLLGKGYRAYNPRLMRFHSPDSWSPFGGGGLNAYMYCAADPVNRVDPTGHLSIAEIFQGLWDLFSPPASAVSTSQKRANIVDLSSASATTRSPSSTLPSPSPSSSAVNIPNPLGHQNWKRTLKDWETVSPAHSFDDSPLPAPSPQSQGRLRRNSSEWSSSSSDSEPTPQRYVYVSMIDKKNGGNKYEWIRNE